MILAHHLFEARNGDTSRLANFGSDLIVGLNQHAASIGQPKHKVRVVVNSSYPIMFFINCTLFV